MVKRDFFFHILHIVTLSIFAFAQPLFDIYSRNAEFFAIRRSEPVDILVLVPMLCLLIPVPFVLIPAIIRAFNPKLGRLFYLFIIWLLAAIIFLPILKNSGFMPPILVPVSALLLSILTTALYIKIRLYRSFLSLASVVIIIFPMLFIFNPQIKKLVFEPDSPQRRLQTTDATTPVFIIIFDELSIFSLLDKEYNIDSIRYPNFAALAQSSYWFKNATSVTVKTDTSLPEILTGNSFIEGNHPTYRDYPDNLFTLLGGTYNIRAKEFLGNICPEQLCGLGTESFSKRIGSLLSDTAVIYLHLIIPESYATGLPPVKYTWKDFGGKAATTKRSPEDDHYDPLSDSGRVDVTEFIEKIEPPGDGRVLYFMHSSLPHRPWRYRPTGELCLDDSMFPPQILTDDGWKAAHYLQRYLMQVGFVDTLLGELLEELKESNLYDEALIMVLSDHGISIRPNTSLRWMTSENFHELLSIPLFIKLPGQKKGVVSNKRVETIDIVPTIADILKIKIPWQVKGRSVFSDEPKKTTTAGALINMYGDSDRYASLKHRVELFGADKDDKGLYNFGPYRSLIGLPTSSLKALPLKVVFTGEPEIGAHGEINTSNKALPCTISGRIEGSASLESPFHIALSVDGTVRTVTRTFDPAGKVAPFIITLPDGALKPGKSRIEVTVLSQVKQDETQALWAFEKADPVSETGYTITDEGILSSKGKPYNIIPEYYSSKIDMHGSTFDWIQDKQKSLVIEGFAVGLEDQSVPDAVLIFLKGRFLTEIPINKYRPDIVERYGNEALSWSGFISFQPLTLFEGVDLGGKAIRFFIISHDNGIATEI